MHVGDGTTLFHQGYITERGGKYDDGETRLLARDRDVYQFHADDFVDITFPNANIWPSLLKPLAFGSTATATYANVYMTPCEKDVLGPRGAYFTVESTTGALGDKEYDLLLVLKPRPLPLDWGEPLETPTLLKPICTPTPPAGEIPGWRPVDLTGQFSSTSTPLAWQHVAGDVDYYDVHVPPGPPPNLRRVPTECDRDPSVEVTATGMKLMIGAKSTIDKQTVVNPDTLFPDHHVKVEIRHPSNGRDAYSVYAKWRQGFYPTPDLCIALEAAEKKAHQELLAIVPVPPEDIVTQPGSDPVELNTNVYDGHIYRELRAETTSMNTVISAKPGATVLAQIFDANGVLLAQTSTPTQETVETSRVPDGLVPQAQLDVSGLTPGNTYLLQVNVAGSIAGQTSTQLGLSP